MFVFESLEGGLIKFIRARTVGRYDGNKLVFLSLGYVCLDDSETGYSLAHSSSSREGLILITRKLCIIPYLYAANNIVYAHLHI